MKRPGKAKAANGSLQNAVRAPNRSNKQGVAWGDVPIGLIDAPLERAYRGSFEDLDELAGSMRGQGQLEACRGLAKPGGRVELVIGYRRYMAAVRANFATLYVLPYDTTDAFDREADLLLARVADNTRQPLLPSEIGRMCAEIHDRIRASADVSSQSVDQTIAERVGLTRQAVSLYRLLFVGLDPKVTEAWRDPTFAETYGSPLSVYLLKEWVKLPPAAQVAALEQFKTERFGAKRRSYRDNRVPGVDGKRLKAALERLESAGKRGEPWYEGAIAALTFALEPKSILVFPTSESDETVRACQGQLFPPPEKSATSPPRARREGREDRAA